MPDAINNLANAAATEKLKRAWGGRLPNWSEFKEATKVRGGLRINRLAAIEAMRLRGAPRRYAIFHTGLTLLSLVIIPGAVWALFWKGLSGFVLVISVVLVPVLWRLSKRMAYDGVLWGATRSETFYNAAVQAGAFYFNPPSEPWPSWATPTEAQSMLGVSQETWDVIGVYAKFMEHLEQARAEKRFDFYPVSDLPLPKEKISRALNDLLGKTTDEDFAKSLQTGLSYLTFAMSDTEYSAYQKGKRAAQ